MEKRLTDRKGGRLREHLVDLVTVDGGNVARTSLDGDPSNRVLAISGEGNLEEKLGVGLRAHVMRIGLGDVHAIEDIGALDAR